MAYTKRQIVTVLSIIYLVALTALASFALHSVRYYSLPIPTVLSAFTVALPAIAGLSIESATEFRRRPALTFDPKETNERSNNVSITVSILLILETAIAALSGTYLIPARNLECPLNDKWRNLFLAKNDNAIKRIQDGLQCCGLHNTVDLAWPYVPINECAKKFEREDSCFERWRGQEQKTAGIMLLIVVLVFVWKILIVTDPLAQPTWVHRVLRIPTRQDDTERDDAERRVIEYPQARERYIDDPAAEAEDLASAVPKISSPDNRSPTLSPKLASKVQASALVRHE